MILIRGGMVYTMTRETPSVMDVLLDQGRIVRVEERITPEENWTVIDASGLNVYPGFIDAHCHLGMSEEAIGFEGNDVNEMTDPVTPQLRAIDGLNPVSYTHLEKAVTAAVWPIDSEGRCQKG